MTDRGIQGHWVHVAENYHRSCALYRLRCSYETDTWENDLVCRPEIQCSYSLKKSLSTRVDRIQARFSCTYVDTELPTKCVDPPALSQPSRRKHVPHSGQFLVADRGFKEIDHDANRSWEVGSTTPRRSTINSSATIWRRVSNHIEFSSSSR